MADYVQLVTTTARRDEAERIAHALVDGRLAACVQIAGPITSVYRWQGKVETSEEWRLLIKTRQALVARTAEAIRQLHPYEVPELLAFPVLWGSTDYLAWVDAQTNIDAGA
jgi:periplasmic divalent cation tolerance protein